MKPAIERKSPDYYLSLKYPVTIEEAPAPFQPGDYEVARVVKVTHHLATVLLRVG